MNNLKQLQKEEEKQLQKTFNTCSTLPWQRKFSCFQKHIHTYAQAANNLYGSPTIVEPFMMWKISKLMWPENENLGWYSIDGVNSQTDRSSRSTVLIQTYRMLETNNANKNDNISIVIIIAVGIIILN